MPAGGGNFQRAPRMRLAFHVQQVRVHGRGGRGRQGGGLGLGLGDMALQPLFAIAGGEVGADLEQRVGRQHDRAGDQRRLRGIGPRQDERAARAAFALHGEGHRQRAPDRPQFAGQR